jgi:hypothetical protein
MAVVLLSHRVVAGEGGSYPIRANEHLAKLHIISISFVIILMVIY